VAPLSDQYRDTGARLESAGHSGPHIPTTRRNHLIAALSPEVRSRLLPHLDLISLPFGKVLYACGDAMRHIYFPIDSIVSLLYVTANGDSTEICLVGNDGLVGSALYLGGDSTPSRAVVLSAGSAYRLPRVRLKEEFDRHGELLKIVLRYTQCLLTQMAQRVVCNRHHSLEQRLCRWLLLSLDRLPSTTLTMTQELISNVLGVRREGVGAAAARLQMLGVIEYSRGRIMVMDRLKLEALSCECYAAVRTELARLMPQSKFSHVQFASGTATSTMSAP
jgi:CRP-like cAMP-binding protein